MDLAGYVINAVLVEGRSVREVAAAHHLGKVPGTVCRRAKPWTPTTPSSSRSRTSTRRREAAAEQHDLLARAVRHRRPTARR